MQKYKVFKLDLTDIVPIFIWIAVTFITWTFMHGSDHFLELTPEALGKYYNFKWILIAHITAGGGALVLGIIQFWKKLRSYSWKLHRMIGFLYLLAILIGSFCAIILAFTTAYKFNTPYAISLQVWAIVWISSTVLAYYFIIKKRFVLHQEWMTRSYIVTLAFVITGLIYKTTFFKKLGNFEDTAPWLYLLGWSVPLFIYEIIRRNRPLK
jgi:hypothetical protein